MIGVTVPPGATAYACGVSLVTKPAGPASRANSGPVDTARSLSRSQAVSSAAAHSMGVVKRFILRTLGWKWCPKVGTVHHEGMVLASQDRQGFRRRGVVT